MEDVHTIPMLVANAGLAVANPSPFFVCAILGFFLHPKLA